MAGQDNRRELANFLRIRRERIAPAQVGLPVGPRRRTTGLRREEVAVLAGLSPTWYTYLEQGRNIHPSPEVLDSLARVLHLSEDERRYMHVLAHGQFIHQQPLDTDLPAEEIVRQLVSTTRDSEYPVYAINLYADIIAWNPAATEWYDDWGRLPPDERNILHWMLTSEIAKDRLPDWENDTRDIVARWRAMTAAREDDRHIQELVAKFQRLSDQFCDWWDEYDVKEHRSRMRRLRHPRSGMHDVRLVVVQAPEFIPCFVAFHLPVGAGDQARY